MTIKEGYDKPSALPTPSGKHFMPFNLMGMTQHIMPMGEEDVSAREYMSFGGSI